MASKFNTTDSKEPWTKAHLTKAYYETNQVDTPFVKITVEQKYGHGESTGFVSSPYVKDGRVLQFQAKFLLNEEIEVPETAIAVIKASTVQKSFKNKEGKKEVKTVQRYVLSK